jgi:peptidoglycan/LPS O-acetylase OafA/YrhL
VFFVISGYLITMLLLEEHRETGTVSLQKFYVRRMLRIFPAFLAFMAALVVLHAASVIELEAGDLLHAATFTMNFHYVRAWSVGHLWSLSVEEQFYLLWPAALLVFGVRRSMVGAALVVVAAPVIRLSIAMWWPSQVAGIGESFPTVADTIAIGCLLAGLQQALLTRSWFRQFLEFRGAFTVIPVTILLLNLKTGGRLRIGVLETLINVLIALCILRVALVTGGPISRVLNSKRVVFIGSLSYSLYLWQQVFMNRNSHALVCAFPCNVALAAGMALVSYFAVERPLFALRARISGIRRQESVRVDARVAPSLDGR